TSSTIAAPCSDCSPAAAPSPSSCPCRRWWPGATTGTRSPAPPKRSSTNGSSFRETGSEGRLSRLQPERHRTVVGQRDPHVRAEDAGADGREAFPGACHEEIEQRSPLLRRR